AERLPDRLLVVVREQFRRQREERSIRAFVLLERQGHDERTDVQLNRESLLVEQRLEPDQVRMQRVLQIVCERLPADRRQRGGVLLGATDRNAAARPTRTAAPYRMIQVVVRQVARYDRVRV